MPGIDKAAFMKRLSGKAPASGYASDDIAGAAAKEPAEETGEGAMTCGEQLMQALDSGDSEAVDNALREAVAKYSGG